MPGHCLGLKGKKKRNQLKSRQKGGLRGDKVRQRSKTCSQRDLRLLNKGGGKKRLLRNVGPITATQKRLGKKKKPLVMP